MVMTEVKHLKTGDAFPAVPTDKLTLFSMRFCPYAQRSHLVLNAKQIPHHVVNVHLKQKPEWLTEINADSKVPILRLTNEPGAPYLAESLIIADYVDDKYPKRLLYPKDPLARATDRLFIDRASALATSYHRALVQKDVAALEENFKIMYVYEAELVRRGTKFFGGATPGMLDYMIWPWIERSEILTLALGAQAKWDAQRLATLIQWKASMESDSAVQETLLSAEVHYDFIKSHLAGNPEYDVLVKE